LLVLSSKNYERTNNQRYRQLIDHQPVDWSSIPWGSDLQEQQGDQARDFHDREMREKEEVSTNS